ncbi:hypothetical protein WJX84_010136 [Apatococcus fuscideae]|uniref:EF-hand domain-containing protein n=1 Tax=Apatococcus fuscideae TaxID=2026836 RepID=A0AAW1SV43_9CHLO
MKVAGARTSVPRPASSNSLQILDQNEAESFSGSVSPFRLSYTVLQEKRARKAAEEDAVRLCNRVKQLQKESERVSKRVNDTKKKIQDVRCQQQRVIDKQAVKEKWHREVQEEIDRQRFLNILSRQQNRQNKSLSEVQLQKERHSQAEEAKEESAEIERVLAESKLLARIEALERKEAVRKDYKKCLEHQNKYRADKIKLAHGEYEKRLREQRGARESKQRELSNLGEMESDLLQKLRQMEMEQTRAEEELCTLLHKPKSVKPRSPSRNTQSMSPSRPSQADPKQPFSAAQPQMQQQQYMQRPLPGQSRLPDNRSNAYQASQPAARLGPQDVSQPAMQDGLSEIQEGEEEPLPDFSDDEIAAAFAQYDKDSSGVMQVMDFGPGLKILKAVQMA